MRAFRFPVTAPQRWDGNWLLRVLGDLERWLVEIVAGLTKLEARTLNVGEVRLWATSTPPRGWLACDGTAVSRTTYATLFGVVGTTFGTGDGSTTFNLPSLTPPTNTIYMIYSGF